MQQMLPSILSIAGDVTDLKPRLTDTWNGLSQSIVDDADDECRKRFRACMTEKGHFEHLLYSLNMNSLGCAAKLVVF